MCNIICPNCNKAFKIDNAEYSQIVSQIRDGEFEKELKRREQELISRNEADSALARMRQEKSHSEALSKKNSELADKDKLISQLKAQLDSTETDKKLAVSEAVQERDKALSEKSTEIAKLRGDLELQKKEGALRESALNEKYKGALKLRDEEIERLKDFKARMSTKMVGESLERHCEDEFNKLRAAGFRDAYFEKDNDARTGSKGDYIFRDYVDGTEYISIMFEMKNEMDGGVSSKHRNEDFLKELDKDRNEKGCEYAVLVSMLEPESELYNSGIVDMSHRYPKIYVIRPQFFIPIITLLRNAAMNSLEYRKKLAVVQSQQVDIFNFEANLTAFKDSFARSFNQASARFDDAIKGIDTTISTLTKIRENLVKSENHLNVANNKLEDVSIKRLTNDAPSVRAMFEDKKDET